jgi:hypothetical protein
MTIRSLGATGLGSEEIREIRLLGHGAAEPLPWRRDECGLIVRMPDEKPCAHAFALKITTW